MIITDFLIVGAGISGIRAAEEILRIGPAAKVCMVNSEKGLPYKRTKINKSLHMKIDTVSWELKERNWYENIDFLESEQVVEIDRRTKTAVCKSGRQIRYGRCLLCKGSEADRTGNPDLPIHLARTAADISELQAELPGKQSVLILGDGVLAVEIAAGLMNTVPRLILAGRNSRLVHKNFSPEVSGEMADLLSAGGVSLMLNSPLRNIEYGDEGFSADFPAAQVRAQLVIQASGVHVSNDIRISPPLNFDNGYLVDKFFKTADPDIFAAGECARPVHAAQSALWHCSEHQGLCAGRNISGLHEAWSDRPFRMKCEISGTHFFSMNPFSGDRYITGSDRIYQEWYIDSDRAKGVIMRGDRENSEMYEKAVLENWTLSDISKNLPV